MRSAGGDTNHGIIAAAQDIAIVDKVSVSDAVEASECFGITDGDRLFAEVGAGHDERVEFGTGKKEMVERGVWQEDADEIIARSDLFHQAGIGLARKQHDGPFDGDKKFAGGIIEHAEAVRGFQTADHDGKRLLNPALPCAKELNGGFRAGIAGEMKPAETLYSDDAILFEKADGLTQWLCHIERHPIGRAEQ